VPRYALKTVSSSAPEFANQEQDVIRQSFSKGNYTWMKHALPVELAPDSVNLLRRQRMEHNRLAEPSPQPYSRMAQLWGGGSYQEFEYIPDEYERRRQLDLEMKHVSTEKREKVSNHDWRHTSQERRLKHEAMVSDPRNKEAYPYLGGNKEEELKSAKLWQRSVPMSARSDSGERPLATEGSFLAGKGRGLEDDSRASRMILPTVVDRLQRRVDADWEGTTVIVNVTDQDLIQISFHMETVDSERGVIAYMNVLGKDVDLLGSLGLKKVSQLWGMKRDFSSDVSLDELAGGNSAMGTDESNPTHTWMFFLLMPKWVRMRPTDAYYTINPQSQGGFFRMSTAGSSVLLSLGSTVLDPADVLMPQRQPPMPTAPMNSSRGNMSARGPGGGGGGAGKPPPGPKPVELSLIEQAISGLPAIRETRGGLG